MGVIYKVTNIENQKVYIGQTMREFKKRKREHFHQAKLGYRNCAYFHSAILKYGIESFIWEILFKSDNIEELNKKEIELISYYNSYGENGYNLCVGGGSNFGYRHSEKFIETKKNFRHSEKTKKEARERMLGTHLSKETKEKLRLINLGKNHSEETRKKMSQSNTGKGTKSVICADTGIVYSSITEAAKSIPCTVGTLSAAVKNNKKVKGLTFKRNYK